MIHLPADLAYLARRAEREAVLAIRATSRQAALAHRELCHLYRARVAAALGLA